MKKILTLIFIFTSIALCSFSAKNSFASNCSNYGGATTYCDDGTSYSNYGGSTTYGSDGTSYSNYGGATTYGSDGSSCSNYGGSTTYCDDGTSYSNYGGSTTYGSDGSTYNNYGGSTTYGSGSGKMIQVGGRDDVNQNNFDQNVPYDSDKSTFNNYDDFNTYDNGNFKDPTAHEEVDELPKNSYEGSENTIFEVNGIEYSEQDLERIRNKREMRNREICGPNAIYIALDQKCVCEVGYKKNGSICVEDSSNDVDSNFDRDAPVKYPEDKNEDKDFVWWNPLTWRSYFFNKSTPAVNNDEKEPIKSIENETPLSSLEWKEYSSNIGKFTALFPYDVAHGNWMDNATMKKLGWKGIEKIDTFSTSGTNDESFSVWFHQYIDQNSTRNKSALQTSLNNLLNLMKKSNYELISSGYSKYGEYDALDYLIFSKGQNKYEKGKFIAVKHNVYQILVDYKGENLNNADIMKFFDSFHLQ